MQNHMVCRGLGESQSLCEGHIGLEEQLQIRFEGKLSEGILKHYLKPIEGTETWHYS
jgi:hypothetical protein